jgi:Fe-S cluster assembly protein SufD
MTQTVSEPAWLAGQRAAARERYAALPVPTNREEAWRFTNLRGFDPDAFEVSDAALQLTEAELPDGVVFGSLATLAAERPELGERY